MSLDVPSLYRRVGLVLIAASIFGWVRPLTADEAEKYWPSFRGPLSTGVSPTADPPTQWSPTDHVQWKVALPGRGSSSPVIWGDDVFLTSAVPKSGQQPKLQIESDGNVGRRRRPRIQPTEHEFIVTCLSRANGETKWTEVATVATPAQGTHPDNTFASASPCTDGQRVIASFGSLGLYCYDLQGKLQWKRDDLGEMITRGRFGEGSSPVIYHDWIVLPWDHEGQSYLALLDKQTGKTVWKVDRDEPTNWATPTIVQRGDRAQIVHSGQNRARGYDLRTGEELWSFAGLTQRPVSSPVTLESVACFASSRGGAFLAAVNIDERGDLNGTPAELWSIEKATPDIPSLLLLGQRLYFLSANTAVMSCVDVRTGGQLVGRTRLGKLKSVYASPVAAAGRIYVTGRDGQTAVLNDELEIVATNEIGERIDATPALVESQLLLRGEQHLFCISGQHE